MVKLLENLFRSFLKMDKQTKSLQDDSESGNAEGVYTKHLGTVIQAEKTKIAERRVKAAREFEATVTAKDASEDKSSEGLTESQEKYKELLALPPETRPSVGLAFSGGGIRSATFNLGLVQGLAKYGFLPWFDYLTSVSGGGLTAACMTTLLSSDKKDDSGKRKYYHFNTQWDYFPFNPEVKVFDSEGVAHVGEPTGEIGPRLKKGTNAQLAYLRDRGNWIIPRMGWATRDMLRGIGTLLVRPSYTVFIFFLVLLAFSAFHYGLTTALTSRIMSTTGLNSLGKAVLIPTSTYSWTTFAVGFAFSFLIGSILRLFYRNDPTRKDKLRPWKSPREDINKETYLAIDGLRIFAGVSFLVLFLLTLWLWVRQYRMLPQPGTALSHFYWAWSPLFVLFALAAGWFVLKYTKDYSWVKRRVPEQLRFDTLVMYTVLGLFTWVMTLLIFWLRLQGFHEDQAGPQIFWIWLPAVFGLGSLMGLVLFRNLPLRQHVYAKAGIPYSLGWFERIWVDRILQKDAEAQIADRDINFKLSVWSSPEFRSIFATLQGLVLYGLIAFLVLAFLALPHYFSVKAEAEGSTVVPLATAIISAGWAALLSYVNRTAGFTPQNLMAKIITLPEGLRNYVLGLLVIVFNLSIIFVIESQIHRSAALHPYYIGLIALGLLWISGRFADFNYLSPHYLFSDRIAEVSMKTEVETEAGQVKVARDNRLERLWWITPKGCSAPYHIVLTALNLPGTWHLKPKDRKSEPFIFSKYYCGSDITGYVVTDRYRGGATLYPRAIALSGAAISPGWGFRTFFAQAFMTTLLNVRLGLWLTNPELYKPDVPRAGARPHDIERRVFWPTYLWDEARAQISERRPLINLTDGEHTGDGIGLYPLFQRRCKVIIAGDASGDPAGHARGLFCVLRQVKVDLGIEVDIHVDGIKPAEYDREKNAAKPSERHFAVGKITYPATFDAEGNKVLPKQEGWLIYFAPAVTKQDPGAILGYWETHKMEFPIPATADQFFDEEQWEVQRWLGEITVEHTLQDLKSYYEEKVKGEDAPVASEKLGFLKELLDNRRIDFDVLAKHPQLIEEFMNALYTISTGTGAKAEEEEGQSE